MQIIIPILFTCLHFNTDYCICNNTTPIFKNIVELIFEKPDIQVAGLSAPHHRLITGIYTETDTVTIFLRFRKPTLLKKNYENPTDILKDCQDEEIIQIFILIDFNETQNLDNQNKTKNNIDIINFINNSRNKTLNDCIKMLGAKKESLIFDNDFNIFIENECYKITMRSTAYSDENDLILVRKKSENVIDRILKMRIDFVEFTCKFNTAGK